MPLIERLSNSTDTRAAIRTPEAFEDAPATRALPRKPQGRRLAATEVDELVAAYEEGNETSQLASRYGIHRSTIRLHLRRRGVQPRPGFDDLALAEAREFYDTGMSVNAVARQIGWDAATVSRHLKAAGVRLR